MIVVTAEVCPWREREGRGRGKEVFNNGTRTSGYSCEELTQYVWPG